MTTTTPQPESKGGKIELYLQPTYAMEYKDAPITYKELDNHQCAVIDFKSVFMMLTTIALCLALLLLTGCGGEAIPEDETDNPDAPPPVVVTPAPPVNEGNAILTENQRLAMASAYSSSCVNCHGQNGDFSATNSPNFGGKTYSTAELKNEIDIMFNLGFSNIASCPDDTFLSPLSCAEAMAEFIFSDPRFNVTRSDPVVADIADVFEAKCAGCHGLTGEGNSPFPAFNGNEYAEGELETVVLNMLDRTAGGESCDNGETGSACAQSIATFLISDARFNLSISDNPTSGDTRKSITFSNTSDAQTTTDLPVATSIINSTQSGGAGDTIIEIEIAGLRLGDNILVQLIDPSGNEKITLVSNTTTNNEDINANFFLNLGYTEAEGNWELRIQDDNGGAFIDRWTITFTGGGDKIKGEQLWSSSSCIDCHRLQLNSDRKGIAVASTNNTLNDDFFRIDPLSLKNTNLSGLAEYIHETMPLGKHTTICGEQCAEDTAAFIRSWIDIDVNGVVQFQK